jgi:hypothetical protein
MDMLKQLFISVSVNSARIHFHFGEELLMIFISDNGCFFFFRNIIHGSDSVETANDEIKLWFKDEELVDWKPHNHCCVYE